MDRRGLLLALGVTACSLFEAKRAAATTARALTLPELVGRSQSVFLATPLARNASWMEVGGARRIVTETRARVEELVAGADPESSEVIFHTLGGQVGKIGQLVEGEADLVLRETSLLFGRRIEQAVFSVAAMAQGHYPLATERGERIVRPSPNLPVLLGRTGSAVARLSGRPLAEARGLVRGEQR
ncbi:MAG TPA: hypothetical protein VGK73_38965 [Polyangiaceae bacterium]